MAYEFCPVYYCHNLVELVTYSDYDAYEAGELVCDSHVLQP